MIGKKRIAYIVLLILVLYFFQEIEALLSALFHEYPFVFIATMLLLLFWRMFSAMRANPVPPVMDLFRNQESTRTFVITLLISIVVLSVVFLYGLRM